MSTKCFRALLLGVCCWQLLVGLPHTGQAASSNSSDGQLNVDFFYDTLKDDGSWFNTTEYGDVWQPYIAYKNDAWRPYTDGYWTYTDGGWMFVSYEDFGWAVYHYGRWTQLKDIGWAWVPGTEWAPAWVSWRESGSGDGSDGGQPAASVAATTTDTGNQPPVGNQPPPSREPSGGGTGGAPAASENYIGWAPLPPDPEPVAYGSSYSYGPSVDVDYGIDPYDYVFTDVRYFGAPWIGGVIFDRDRGYYCAERSVNVSNFYYNRQGGYRGFYNGGPRYDRFNGVTERPIPRLNINREQGRAAREAIRAGQFNQINGNRVNIVAPRFSQVNVRNGRVNFKNRGTLPVNQVDRNGLTAQGDNGARDRARNTFRQQGETFRTQNPKSASARLAARQAARQAAGQRAESGANPGLATTPRAQREEQAARQEARREGANASGASGGPNLGNPAQPGPDRPANPAVAAGRGGTKAERRAARQQARQQAASAARAGNGDRAAANAARQQAREARRSARQSSEAANTRRAERQAVPREVRAPRGGGDGGGGGGRAMRVGGGGGGGRGGGGQAPRGGGGDHGGGGHGGEKKR